MTKVPVNRNFIRNSETNTTTIAGKRHNYKNRKQTFRQMGYTEIVFIIEVKYNG